MQTYALTCMHFILGIYTYGAETTKSVMYHEFFFTSTTQTQTACEICLHTKVKASVKSIKSLYEV